MQNKGLIKFFAILFALVSIYQLSFTFVSSKDCGTGTPLTVANAPGGLVCDKLLAHTALSASARNSARDATENFKERVCMMFA